MRKISIVIDDQGKIFKTRKDKKKLFWKSPQATPNPNSKLNPRVRVGVNSWKNEKRCKSATKCKRLVSSQTLREKALKLGQTKKYLFQKRPQANPNPKLNPRVRVRVNSWENEKRSEPETKCKRLVSSQTFRDRCFKFVQTIKFLSWK